MAVLYTTEETKSYYRQALTYWLAVFAHGENSPIASKEKDILKAYEGDAIGAGVPEYELMLLKAHAKVSIERGRH